MLPANLNRPHNVPKLVLKPVLEQSRRLETMRTCLRNLMRDPRIIHDVQDGLTAEHHEDTTDDAEEWAAQSAKICPF